MKKFTFFSLLFITIFLINCGSASDGGGEKIPENNIIEPNIFISNLTEDQVVSEDYTITGTVYSENKIVSVTLMIDGSIYNAVGNTDWSKWTYEIKIGSFNPGNHTITATATDVKDNELDVSLTFYAKPPASDRIDLTTYGSDSLRIESKILIDQNDKAHIFYTSKELKRNNINNIAYRISNNWAQRIDINSNTFDNSYHPESVIDNTGKIHLVYQVSEPTGDYDRIEYRNSDDWSYKIDIELNQGYRPQIVIHNNKIHLFYSTTELDPVTWKRIYHLIYCNSDDFTQKNYIRSITDIYIGAPQVAIDSNGKIHVVYYSREFSRDCNNLVYINSDDWSKKTFITSSHERWSDDHQIAVDSKDIIHVLYESSPYFSNNNIVYMNSNNWSEKINITEIKSKIGAVDSDSLDMIIDKEDTIHIVYGEYYKWEYNYKPSNIIYRNSDNWSVATNITNFTDEDSQHPDIAIDSNGKIHIVYASNEYFNNENVFDAAYRSLP